ncbi:MAG: UDP-N-acetylmuramoyl-L-alanine--D-glutamate ligase [Gammaproteobacteria bacterium]|nr:UDP-N-acetylmuramoyl-L-alanine--D-glutamate ligase [Gammaproteobacteria bacterium]
MRAETAESKVKVVVGLGQTGLSCARYLSRRQESFKVIDTRQNPPGLQQLKAECPDVELELGDFREETLMNAAQLIVSPGVDQQTPAIRKAVASGVSVTGDVDMFASEVQAPVIAITGSNAKSTVTSLVGEMARAEGLNVAVAGNIGLPVLDLLQEAPASLYVLELSSFQLETTSNLGAEVATVLNLSLDHMDRYASMEAYRNAKQRIFQKCRQAVINADDSMSRIDLPSTIKKWHFSLAENSASEFSLLTRDDKQYLGFNSEILMPVSDLKLVGSHNVANALAALALGHAAGLSMTAMLSALKSFRGLPHRCQWVAEKNGVNWFNDSKGTNVGACIAAIQGLGGKGKLILLAGGQGKGADFSALTEPLSTHAKLAILFGEDAGLINEAVKNAIMTLTVSSMEEAVQLASSKADAGDIVLLSPACASFDMFSNYEERGEVFMHCVGELH